MASSERKPEIFHQVGNIFILFVLLGHYATPNMEQILRDLLLLKDLRSGGGVVVVRLAGGRDRRDIGPHLLLGDIWRPSHRAHLRAGVMDTYENNRYGNGRCFFSMGSPKADVVRTEKQRKMKVA